jgi:hypothetical protein
VLVRGNRVISTGLDWYGAKDQALRDQYDQLAEQLQAVQGGDGFQQLDADAYREYRATHQLLLDEPDQATGTDPAQGSGA